MMFDASVDVPVVDLFKSHEPVKICAPMVRYSGFPFRKLVRKYGCDLAFTPMIIAESFVQSSSARENEFSFDSYDRPLIVQFAAKCSQVLSNASVMVSNCCDGVDINCGCPQRWAIQDGYGCSLLKKPELIADMVSSSRRRIAKEFSVSVKVRVSNDMRKTVELCRRAESAGCSWVTVHGRTPEQRCQPADWNAIKVVADSLTIPVIANGDVWNLRDVREVHRLTGVKGVMAARGILANPAMFAGYEATPASCVRDWLKITTDCGTSFTQFHNHLIYMLENVLSKSDRKLFNSLVSRTAVLQLLEDYGVCVDDAVTDDDDDDDGDGDEKWETLVAG